MELRELRGLSPLYILPEDDLLNEVIIPCLRMSSLHDCLIGFFHSFALREMAPGLADFLANPGARMRLLISPFISLSDQAALKEGIENAPDILANRMEELYGSAIVDSSALVKHTLECLAYLISAQRIEIKIVLVNGGLFHPKIRIFGDGHDVVGVHGSNNFTVAGLISNVEQITVSRSWVGGDQLAIVDRLVRQFERLWDGERPKYIRVYPLPQALRDRIVRDFGSITMPTSKDFLDALKVDSKNGLTSGELTHFANGHHRKRRRFEIPPETDYERGDFAHQGKAIAAWEQAGRSGILEMATGSGKTITSLIAAKRLLDQVRPLLVVIAAPYLPLVTQWVSEVRKFGLEPIVPGAETSKSQKVARVQAACRNLNLGIYDVECIVITHDFLCDAQFKAEIGRYTGHTMLIADEVHDLGTRRFLTNTPEVFQYRLGLSATPVRQYDEVGTAELVEYFGEVVFRFTLEEAIGKCLVPYEYFVHPVELTTDEVAEWLDLTAKLKALGWQSRSDKDGDQEAPPQAVQRLLNRRRRILEQAQGKINALRDALNSEDIRKLCHTLVYASDKGREQLRQVNSLLMDDLDIRIHQITQAESGDSDLMARLMKDFARGDGIQVLTAMRVLDEGVDIPEVSRAYILASTTVERQWVQRRGRVLRKCSRIHKNKACVHDFLVIPPDCGQSDYYSKDILNILKAELKRIVAFAKLSLNAAAPGGGLTVISPIVNQYF